MRTAAEVKKKMRETEEARIEKLIDEAIMNNTCSFTVDYLSDEMIALLEENDYDVYKPVLFGKDYTVEWFYQK